MVDVRDMLCAQALAVVARAAGTLYKGEVMDVRFNAEDVKRDLLVWAREQGHQIALEDKERVRVVIYG